MSKVTILKESCKGFDNCGICAFVCPKDLYRETEEMNEQGYYPPQLVDEEKCTSCQNCMIYCPDFAIVVEKSADKADETRGEDESE